MIPTGSKQNDTIIHSQISTEASGNIERRSIKIFVSMLERALISPDLSTTEACTANRLSAGGRTCGCLEIDHSGLARLCSTWHGDQKRIAARFVSQYHGLTNWTIDPLSHLLHECLFFFLLLSSRVLTASRATLNDAK